MAQLVLSIVVGDDGGSIAASDDDGRAAAGGRNVRVEQVLGAARESGEFEHAGGPVTTVPPLH